MEILKVSSKNSKQIIEKTLEFLKEGKVVVSPTDTVYGLIADAANKKAVARLYQIKQRPKKKIIPVFVSDIKMAKKIAKINQKQGKFLKQVWPGAVTAVFHYKKPGIRIPNHKLVLGLIKRIGPLAETSANISGEPATTKIKEVLGYFKGRDYQPDLVLDAGNLKKSKPSKVIDLTVWPPKILRQ